MDASGERASHAKHTRRSVPDTGGETQDGQAPATPAAQGRGKGVVQRRVASAGWLCAVVTAMLVGAWAFQNADPDAGYASHDPLDESAVRNELHSGGGSGTPHVPDTVPPSGTPSTAEPSGEPPATSGEPPSSPGTVALKLPQGGATATVQCLSHGRIRLAGLSPAEGYGVDDVVHGPGTYVSFELEPPDDDGDDDADDPASVRSSGAASSEDQVVRARCRDGRPVTSVGPEKEDEEPEGSEGDDPS